MHRYLLEIQYLGEQYQGWQKQPNIEHKTIQGILEINIAILTKYKTPIFAAGRTDSKVNARQQFAHFDTYKKLEEKKFIYSLNSLLKQESIAIKSIKLCENTFHARFDCKTKIYKYYILTSKTPNVFSNTYWWQPKLDINDFIIKANEYAKHLLGQHDFASFQDAQCGAKTSIRTIEKCEFYLQQDENNNQFIIMQIQARAFLKHQVRITIGTILDLYQKNAPYETIQEILEKKDRTFAGKTAPSQGLFLDKIIY